MDLNLGLPKSEASLKDTKQPIDFHILQGFGMNPLLWFQAEKYKEMSVNRTLLGVQLSE